MITIEASKKVCSPRQAAQLSRGLTPFLYQAHHAVGLGYPATIRVAAAVHQSQCAQSLTPCSGKRSFSTTGSNQLRDVFPIKDTPYIRQTPPAWEHPGYTEEEMRAVVPGHRKPETVGDWVAWKLVRLARWATDLATGIGRDQQVDMKNPTTALVAEKPLTEAQWLVRVIFLESIAGVPGMVGGMLRHLHSLRRMKRDNGWIETLLEESYNERMHLLTFMKVGAPGWFMKTMILGAQGVFFNAMFLSYLVSPKITHRFVGYLEEEAVHTYTRMLHEIERGDLPKWSDPKFEVPEIAVSYWRMPEGKRTMKDLILYIRADEAVHRGVNHTLSNLKQKEDPNPFVSEYRVGEEKRKPQAGLKPTGYERNDVIG
ncbi:alternative oxidase-domain-containing protein [Dichotomopilus funicola]|uniref:Alternative oxidase n=1 Tax=Dichotomopilus funicola TaxID=1934379 RepID=A0AAN6V831_9PEZI|nr:alternative oxidase-domain-containing protein [Dichotomopilus funicola]